MKPEAPRPEQRAALWALWREAFGDGDEFLSRFWGTAFSPFRCRCITAPDGSVASALYWFDCTCAGERVAYLYAIATSRTYRGQGLCRALMEDTHRHLAKAGYAGALLVPGEESLFAFYEGQGYKTSTFVDAFEAVAADASVPLRTLDAETYAKKRRAYLPLRGVLQENESIAFLETMAHIYEGDGFLLAARREGDVLVGLELLGDASRAHGIVRALGCKTGTFRTVGSSIPFAMYRAFKDAPPPAYFGLAFE